MMAYEQAGRDRAAHQAITRAMGQMTPVMTPISLGISAALPFPATIANSDLIPKVSDLLQCHDATSATALIDPIAPRSRAFGLTPINSPGSTPSASAKRNPIAKVGPLARPVSRAEIARWSTPERRASSAWVNPRACRSSLTRFTTISLCGLRHALSECIYHRWGCARSPQPAPLVTFGNLAVNEHAGLLPCTQEQPIDLTLAGNVAHECREQSAGFGCRFDGAEFHCLIPLTLPE
jgi:hypothetical protein